MVLENSGHETEGAPQWTPERGWNQPMPSAPVAPVTTVVAVQSALTLGAVLASLPLALSTGELGSAPLQVVGGAVAGFVLPSWVLRRYSAKEALSEGLTARLPADAQIGDWLLALRHSGPIMLVLVALAVALAWLRWPDPSILLWAGLAVGGLTWAVVSHGRDARDGRTLYIELRWASKRRKPYYFEGPLDPG